jgi:hypothetical protein
MGQVRHGSATTTRAVRAAIMGASPPLGRGMARMIAGFARASEPGARHQSQDGGEVAEAGDGRGHEDRPDGTAVHRADGGRPSRWRDRLRERQRSRDSRHRQVSRHRPGEQERGFSCQALLQPGIAGPESVPPGLPAAERAVPRAAIGTVAHGAGRRPSREEEEGKDGKHVVVLVLKLGKRQAGLSRPGQAAVASG